MDIHEGLSQKEYDMTIKKVCGAILVGVPFVALAVFTLLHGGLIAFGFIFGGTALIVGCICGGLKLILE